MTKCFFCIKRENPLISRTSEKRKVLQRERKRHTDRSLTRTPYAVLSRGTYLGRGGTYLGRGDTYLGLGGTYLGWGVPTLGYLPVWTWWMVPALVYPHLDLAGVPPPPCGQTENITFPHSSDAVGKNHRRQELSRIEIAIYLGHNTMICISTFLITYQRQRKFEV